MCCLRDTELNYYCDFKNQSTAKDVFTAHSWIFQTLANKYLKPKNLKADKTQVLFPRWQDNCTNSLLSFAGRQKQSHAVNSRSGSSLQNHDFNSMVSLKIRFIRVTCTGKTYHHFYPKRRHPKRSHTATAVKNWLSEAPGQIIFHFKAHHSEQRILLSCPHSHAGFALCTISSGEHEHLLESIAICSKFDPRVSLLKTKTADSLPAASAASSSYTKKRL